MTSDSMHCHVTRWLSLAATPVFAVMAVVSGGDGGGMPGMVMPEPSPLGGMTAMYVLMSIFHMAPWLKLVARRRNSARTALLRH